MAFPVHGLEPRVLHVRVNLRGGDAGMAQKFLQSADFGSPSQHVSGKTVTQSVRAHLVAGSHAPGIWRTSVNSSGIL